MSCHADGLTPAADHDLSALRQIGAAGSPLPAQGYRWVLEQSGPEVLLNVGGGTDLCAGRVQGSSRQPLWAGEISDRASASRPPRSTPTASRSSTRSS
jgi:acetoacetyl-CoA synthetase